MTYLTPKHALFGVWVVAALSVLMLMGGAVASAQGTLGDTLLAEGEKRQVIQFNPNAALQKRIFADGYVPNSSEFSLAFEGAEYAAQRAENLGSGQVRVYFVRVGDWNNVRFTLGGDALGNALMAEAQKRQVIQFNPGAALQKRIFADGFVPNSAEFATQDGGTAYSAQRSENLGNGQVRVYYVAVGDWNNVRSVSRGGSIPITLPSPTATRNVTPAPPTILPSPQAPRPSPTRLILASDSIGGALEARILYTSVAAGALYIEVEARERRQGSRNGDGVARVLFEIFNASGQRVHRLEEMNPRFCAMGGDECLWDFAANNNRWPNSNTIIQNGEYTVRATIFFRDGGSSESDDYRFRIQR